MCVCVYTKMTNALNVTLKDKIKSSAIIYIQQNTFMKSNVQKINILTLESKSLMTVKTKSESLNLQ